MKQEGCLGLMLGSVLGALFCMLATLFLLRPVPPPPSVVQSSAITPDITIFISEQSLSRLASKNLGRDTLIDFDPNGQMKIITQVEAGSLQPVIQLGLLLDMQGTEMVSQLRWVKIGFLAIPARWLPVEARDLTVIAGQAIQSQIPPDFALIGLKTTANGLNFQLKWLGNR